MTSLIFLGILGLGAGAAQNLMLRYLTYRLVTARAALVPAFLLTALLRALPALALLGALALWGAAPALSGLTGYWIGRTSVLALSLGRR